MREIRTISELQTLPDEALATTSEAMQFFAGFKSENSFALAILRENIQLKKVKLGSRVRFRLGDVRKELRRLGGER